MFDWWIYIHFINKIWFVLFGLSFPSILGIYLIYSNIKQNNNQSNNQTDESNKQGNE
jgi:cbb3-type cytochrome oxidase subunit 3